MFKTKIHPFEVPNTVVDSSQRQAIRYAVAMAWDFSPLKIKLKTISSKEVFIKNSGAKI